MINNSPLRNGSETFPAVPSRQLPAIEPWVRDFLAAGCPAARVGIGVPFYAHVWQGGAGTDTGGVTRPRQQWTSPPRVSGKLPYRELAARFEVSEYRWDEVAAAAYLSIDQPGAAQDLFISFDNEQAVAAKVEYVRAAGLGGLAVWELAGGHRAELPAGERDPLLTALGEAVARTAPPSQPAP